MRRRAVVDLLAQPPDEDVDGAVAVRLAAAPHLLQQLVARDDAAAVERERVEQPELGRRQLGALAVDERLHLARVDPQLLDLDRVAALLLGRPHAAAGRGADARDQLLHRERLDEVVVGADLERVDAVVLGAAGETTTIGVPIPSARAVSISRQPSSSGSIRSSTQTSGLS